MFDLIENFLNLKFFFHQIVASLPYNATEIVKFLKTFNFFRKKVGLFIENIFFSKSGKVEVLL